MSLTLIALSYSPWSERARWALDHHRMSYREVEHVPMLGGPWLRLRTKRLVGKTTVPVLVDGREAIFDSFRIAQRAEAAGGGSPLFPTALFAQIEGWNRSSEAILQAGRARLIGRTLADRGALREALPPVFPDAVRPAMESMARVGAHFIAAKYGTRRSSDATHLDVMRTELSRLREVVGATGKYVLGAFSFADIAMAVAMQMVAPVSDDYLRIGPATRSVWTEPELAAEFSDLLVWRDWVYSEHRRG